VARQEGTWTTDAAGFTNIVPNCSIGFDYRDLVANGPVSGTYQNPSDPNIEANQVNPNWTVMPTAAQVKTHLQNAMAFVVANSFKCPANTISMYSLTEYQEATRGLEPTAVDKGEYLQTLGTTLGQRDYRGIYRARGMPISTR
jgi:hypothetical protein